MLINVVLFLASANSNGIVLNVVLFGKLRKVQLAASCESDMSTKVLVYRVCYIFVVILTHRTHIFSQHSFTCDRCQDLHSDAAQTLVLFLWDYSKGSGPGSSVGIATGYKLDGPASNPGEDEIFRPSRPALGPTQPPVIWVTGLSRGKSAAGACCWPLTPF